jgi:Xaa-Pro dipeptidase
MSNERVSRLDRLMQENGLDAIALNPGPTFLYLTSISFHLMERPIVALFAPDRQPWLVLPAFERTKAEAGPVDFRLATYEEDEASRIRAFEQAAAGFGLRSMRVGVDPLRLRVLELRLLEAAAPKAKFVNGESALVPVRASKDEVEVAAMRKAVEIAETALEAAMTHARVGVSEHELAGELTLQLLRAGSDPELPFSPIVAAGPNSALPHGVPGDRKIHEGDLLLIDWGANHDGYISDITRTFSIGAPDPELERIHKIVQEANAAGRQAVRPGAPCSDVDNAARSVIAAAGYAEFFTHRTGHGIGLDVHEPPYIRGDNLEQLTPGMTFTVEPGIYLTGRGGVRIEDDVLVTADGGQTLTSFPREMRFVG